MRPTDLPAIEAYLDHLRMRRRSARTLRTYRSVLARASAAMPHGLCALPDEVTAWLGSRRAHNTAAGNQSVLRCFYDWATANGWLDPDDHPLADQERLQVRAGLPRPVPLNQLRLILEHAREPMRLWMQVMAYAGLRCVDVAGLRREDVTADTVHIRESKGGVAGSVPCHPELWALLEPLRPGLIAGGADPDRISRRVAEECDRIALDLDRPELAEVTAHRMRHTAGTIWQRATGDVRVTQQLLRHSQVANTMIYTAVADDRLREAVAAMPVLVGAAAPEPARPVRPRGRNQRRL